MRLMCYLDEELNWRSGQMDAKEFFSVVVLENYKEAIADPANLRKLWNAAVSMNTVAEYLALHRAGYPTLDRFKVDEKAKAVRSEYSDLKAINSYVDRLKHVSMKDNR
jgi:hypothetical protein